MPTANIFAEEFTGEPLLADLSAVKTHPRDSSQLLLGLIALARNGPVNHTEVDTSDLESIISRKVLRGLLSTLQLRDFATVRHSRRVAMLSIGLAEYLGWEGKQIKSLEIAALLHDIGKIGVPDNILFKPGKLSPDEIELMSLHRNIAVDILQACRVERTVLEIIEHSYSNFDGSTNGYKTIGGEMHQGARILAVADAYDSLRTNKTYRQAKSHDEIIETLRAEAGVRFDGNIVASLARWAQTDGLTIIQNSAAGDDAAEGRNPFRPEETIEAGIFGHLFSYLYMIESLYDGFFVIDSDLRFVVWNFAAEKLLGQNASALLGRNWTSQVLACADEKGNQLQDQDYPINKVLAGGRAETSVLQIQRKDKRWIKIELQAVPLRDKDNLLQGIAGIFRDLSRSGRKAREYHKLKAAASKDYLTSVANRGQLQTQWELLHEKFTEDKDAGPYSVIFLDVDFFKNINDTYGHAVGDRVLVDLAKLLQHETYSGELVSRYGGEEFVVLCPETDMDQAFKRAERLRKAIDSSDIGGATEYRVTASFGVTQVEPEDTVETVLQRADKALYLAKDAGRNTTVTLKSTDRQPDYEPETPDEVDPDAPFIFQASFSACIAADMIVYKLGGFVNDEKAKLLDVSTRQAKLRVGTRRLLWPFWGDTDDVKPVEMSLAFEDSEKKPPAKNKRASQQVQISCEIVPLGKVKQRPIFEDRARRLFKTLRTYFAAE